MPSTVTTAAYNIKSLTIITYHTCHQVNRAQDILPILPVLKDFPTFPVKVLETESLIGSNASYCNICAGTREGDSKFSVSSVGNCLIVQQMVPPLRTLHHFLLHLPLRWLLN